MKAPGQIETTRLILRQPKMSDAITMFERYASDPEVTRFLGWPRHRSVRDTETFLQFSAEDRERWPAGPYLIISRTDGQLLGSTGLGFQSTARGRDRVCSSNRRLGKGLCHGGADGRHRCDPSDRCDPIVCALPS